MGSVEQSITQLYQQILNRTPNQTEIDYWVNEIDGGLSIDELTQKIDYSQEAILLKLKKKSDDPESDGVTVNLDGHTFFIDSTDKVAVETYLTTDYEPGTTDFVKRILKKGMNVINIGANIGYFTLLAARSVGPEGKVFAFEPFPNTVSLLEKNVTSNKYKNVTIIPMAVSDKKETSFLVLKSESGYNFVSSAPSMEFESVSINTTTLDDYFDIRLKIDFIILDAEGYEPRVIDGMKNIIEKNPKIQILTEYNPHTLLAAGWSDEKFLEKLESLGLNIKLVSDDGTLKKYFKDDLLEIKYPNTATSHLTKY